MARQFTFRLQAEGVAQLKRDLESLGDKGKQVFDGLAASAPGLADGLNKANDRARKARESLEGLGKSAQGAGQQFRGAGMAVQQAGLQVGDFFVQVASGQGVMRPLIQQGTQFISMFGPWGAVIGAAGAILGALATSVLGFGDAAEEAEKKQEAFNKTLERAAELMGELEKKSKRTRQSLEAERGNTIGVAELNLRNAEQKLAQMDARVTEYLRRNRLPEQGRAPAEANIFGRFTGNLIHDQRDEVKRLREEYTLLQATLGVFDEGFKLFGQAGTTATKDIAKAQREIAEGLEKELQLASASNRERFIAQAVTKETAKLEGATAAQLAETTAIVREKAGAIYDATEAQKDQAKATAEANREAERAAEQNKDAVAALDAQVAALEDERAQLKMTEKERFVHNALLKAEAQIRKGLVEDADRYREAVRKSAGALFEESKAIDEADRAREEAKRDADRAAKERQRELERAAEQQADMMRKPWENALQGIQGEAADFLKSFADGSIRSGREAAAGIRSVFTRLFAELAAVHLLKPVFGNLLGAVGLGQSANNLGIGGGLGSGSSGFGSISTGGGSSGGSGGFNLGSLFSGGSVIGNWLGGTNGAGSAFAAARPGINPALGPQSLLSGINWGGSALAGVMSALPMALEGNWAGAAISGVLGAGGMAIGGPIGGLIGGTIGNLIGGLFGKKKPKLKKNEAEAWLEASAFGLPVIDYTDTDGKVPGGMGNELGQAARDAVGLALSSAGATLDDATRLRLSYYHSTKGGKTKSEFYKATMFADLAGLGLNNISGEIQRYASVEDALKALSAGALFSSGLQGNIAGTGATTQAAFRYLYTDGGSTKGSMSNVLTDVDKVMEVINFTKWIDGFDKVRTESDAAEKAINDFNASLAKFSAQAEDLGISGAQVLEAMRRDFTEGVSGELLQLTDPRAFALAELEKEYAARKAVAEKLGVDLIELEKLYALKRQQILDSGLQGVAETWKDFVNQLQFGELSGISATDQLANAAAQYEASKSVGGAEFREKSTAYLAILKEFFGSTEAYTSVFREVLDLAKQFGGLAGVPGFAAGGDHKGGWMIAGEKGAELVATGAARVFNAHQTSNILREIKAAGGGRDGDGMNLQLISGLLALNRNLGELVSASKRADNENRLTREMLRGRNK